MTRSEMQVIVVPGSGESRTYRLSYARLQVLRGLAISLGVLVVFLVATWGFMISRLAHVGELEAEVGTLRAEQAQIPALLRQLRDLEGQYEKIQGLFSPQITGGASELWLLPPGSLTASSMGAGYDDGNRSPDSWPLTESGFVTQGLLDNGELAHRGMDIAIPTGSYIRAVGAGEVVEVGEDLIYGIYVRIHHGNGYESLYAHASLASVEVGELVRKNEVIGFTGSTGRSTAPHLHFEIVFEGKAVDPLELVRQP